MNVGKDGLDELVQDIRKLIDNNRKFLDTIMEDDFAPEEEPSVAEEEFEEL